MLSRGEKRPRGQPQHSAPASPRSPPQDASAGTVAAAGTASPRRSRALPRTSGSLPARAPQPRAGGAPPARGATPVLSTPARQLAGVPAGHPRARGGGAANARTAANPLEVMQRRIVALPAYDSLAKVNAQNTRHAIGCLRRDECVTADHVAALLRSDGVDAEGERRKELSKCLLRLCEVTPRQPNPPLHHAGHGVFKVLVDGPRVLAAGAEAAAAAAAAHDEATKARGTWVSAGASVDKKDAVAHASRAREPASAGGAPQPPAPPAASPPAVSQQCVIVRGAVQFEPGDAEIEAEVARIIDRDQMKRDGGRGLLSREDLLKALRKLGRARGVGDALADQWEQRDLRVGAAVLAALRKLQADLRVASPEARARGARLSEVLDAVLEQLRDAHEVPLQEFLRAGLGGKAALRQPLHVDGPFLQLLLALCDGPATLFDQKPPVRDVRGVVARYDPHWAQLRVSDPKAVAALNNGAGTLLLAKTDAVARMCRPCSVEALLRGAGAGGVAVVSAEEAADAHRGDLVILLPWVPHAGPASIDRNSEFRALPLEPGGYPYGAWAHIMPWTLAMLAGAPGTLAVLTSEYDEFGPWSHFDQPVRKALYDVALAMKRVDEAKRDLDGLRFSSNARDLYDVRVAARLERFDACMKDYGVKRETLAACLPQQAPVAKKARR